MNYYLPYTNIPYATNPVRTGILSSIFKNGINWGTIISNTQKTLNIVNQTIPVIKQMGPVVNNAKTMFKIMNEFKKVDTPKKEEKIIAKEKKQTEQKNNINSDINNHNNPTFFQ